MRKKVFMVLILMVCVFCVPSAFAANITGCEAVLPDLVIDQKIPNVVHTIIVAIKVVVPIILVIFGMLDLFKGVMAQKEDEIKKGQQIFIKRIIAAAIVFFVVTIVQLVVSFVADGEAGIMDCASCFINGTEEDGSCKGVEKIEEQEEGKTEDKTEDKKES